MSSNFFSDITRCSFSFRKPLQKCRNRLGLNYGFKSYCKLFMTFEAQLQDNPYSALLVNLYRSVQILTDISGFFENKLVKKQF